MDPLHTFRTPKKKTALATAQQYLCNHHNIYIAYREYHFIHKLCIYFTSVRIVSPSAARCIEISQMYISQYAQCNGMCDIWIILVIGCFKTLWTFVFSDSIWSLQFYFMPYYTRTVKYTQSYVKIPDEYSYKHSWLCVKRMWTVGKEMGLGAIGSQQPNTVNLQLSVKQQKKKTWLNNLCSFIMIQSVYI